VAAYVPAEFQNLRAERTTLLPEGQSPRVRTLSACHSASFCFDSPAQQFRHFNNAEDAGVLKRQP
jgi:hypothetical protein